MTENPWQLWLEQTNARAGPGLPERMRQMRLRYGATEGKTCKTCAHLLRNQHHTKTYLKCLESGKLTHGPGTDWKAGWPACGKYEESEAQ